MEVSDHWKKVILKNLVYISKNTGSISELLLHLIQGDVITVADKELIDSFKGQQAQVAELMLQLTRKDPEAYECLLRSLYETGNEHVAKVLHMTDAELSQLMKQTETLSRTLLRTGLHTQNEADVSNSDDDVNDLKPTAEVLDQIRVAAQTQTLCVREQRDVETSPKKLRIHAELPTRPVLPQNTNKKVVFIGDGNTGKTCLITVLMTGMFPVEYLPTVFDNYSRSISVNGCNVNLLVFDTAGQDDYSRLRPLSYPQTDLFVIIFAVDSPASLASVEGGWIPEIKPWRVRTSTPPPVVLLDNRTDLRGSPNARYECATFEEGEEMAARIGAATYMECSAKTGENVNEVINLLVKASEHLPEEAMAKPFSCCQLT